MQFLSSRSRGGEKEKRKRKRTGEGETRGTTTARAQPRVSQCPLTTDGCWRTGRPRYTSRLGSLARTIQRRERYICEPIPDIYMHRAPTGFCTIVEMPPFTKLKLYRGKSVLPCLVLNSGFHVFARQKPRLAVTLRYCNTCRALFHSISHIYRCIQFFSRSKRFCKETILDLQNSSFLFPLKILISFKLFVKNTYNLYIYIKEYKINIKFPQKNFFLCIM